MSGKLCNELLSIGKTENRIHPAGTYTRDILSRFLIDLSWNSSRLEGNTYSLLETKRLIERGESSAGKDATEAQMILNHKRAIEYLVDTAEDARLGSLEICSIHALLSENLLGDPSASGRLRQLTVGISGTSYSRIDNPYILKELFQQFIEKFNLIKNPFEQSFFSLVHLSYLQAFEDVNKRTSRLVANFPLIRANLIPLSFTDVNEQSYVKALLDIYEKNDIGLLQDLYVQAYKMSAQKYSASQQPMNETQIFKLKYRAVIQDIIRAIIIDNATTSDIVGKIRQLVAAQKLSDADNAEMFNVIETEIVSLHEGNIARFKIRPSEFHLWKKQHPNF